ncbi:hypothetical protein GGX14DRAFT_391326 [Mycena pura]|uniref:Uncharacterized protein n=1 Tax=Mycena pura TaxID=153505 RepID=A0AAD6VMK2_9AGAR|nr:hypothetical protein GGX14DRAFT_391326 [Mycena pura]
MGYGIFEHIVVSQRLTEPGHDPNLYHTFLILRTCVACSNWALQQVASTLEWLYQGPQYGLTLDQGLQYLDQSSQAMSLDQGSQYSYQGSQCRWASETTPGQGKVLAPASVEYAPPDDMVREEPTEKLSCRTLLGRGPPPLCPSQKHLAPLPSQESGSGSQDYSNLDEEYEEEGQDGDGDCSTGRENPHGGQVP